MTFRYATPHDLYQLHCSSIKKIEPNESDVSAFKLGARDKKMEYGESMQWSLKHFGYMLCAEQIKKNKPKKILEIGAGFNTYIDRVFNKKAELWMADRLDYYPPKVFKHAQVNRKKTKYVEALVGDYNDILPDDYFDFILSVSAIEHHPIENVESLYKDMYRLTQKGGVICHTIDVTYDQKDEWPVKHFDALKKAGFKIDGKPELEWSYGGDTTNGPLTEPVYNTYAPWRPRNMWGRQVQPYPVATIICIAKK